LIAQGLWFDKAPVEAPLPGRDFMSRKFPFALLIAGFIAAAAAFGPAAWFGFTGSAEAALNLNSSRSNNYRMAKPPSVKPKAQPGKGLPLPKKPVVVQ
jgi:hypothetical protein